MSEQIPDVSLLKKIPIFSALTDSELQKILDAPENGIIEYGMKETIIKESEIGDCMYIVLDGNVEVMMRGLGREIAIATLRSGDFFGEQALTIVDETGRRNATVKSLNMAKLFKIDKKFVTLTLKGEKDFSEDVTVPSTSSEKEQVKQLISGMRLFESLKDKELESIETWTEVSTVGPGEFVIKESEKGNCLFVVLDGSVEIFTMDDNEEIIVLARHKKGGYFGEQSLLPGSTGKRTAYARSNGIAKLIRVPKAYFRLILNRDSELADSLSKAGQDQKAQLDEIKK
ncbi:MAG: cyclic nucleotide-binding domain-containing protein [Gammaproteobacteria bacterium]|nr:cyclic nucleotide-binding domain-containing protein [Gammaproteobacteria bacterium]